MDTSKLKSQLLAISQKYDNQYENESSRARALREKNELMQKYFALKDSITDTHTFDYSGSYNCGESLGLSECKIQLQNNIKNYTKKELADKYDIESSLIKMADIELQNYITSTTNYGLAVSYNGTVEAKASSVKNPYIDEINSLNAFLGEKQIIDEDEKPKGPSFTKRISESISSRRYMLFYTSYGQGSFLYSWSEYLKQTLNFDEDVDKLIQSFELYIQLIPESKYSIKLGKGSVDYDKQPGFQTATWYKDINSVDKNYKYDYSVIGLSIGNLKNNNFGFSFDLDYIIPTNISGHQKNYLYSYVSYGGTKEELIFEKEITEIKPFFNLGINLYAKFDEKIWFSGGLLLGGEEAFKQSLITVKAGFIF